MSRVIYSFIDHPITPELELQKRFTKVPNMVHMLSRYVRFQGERERRLQKPKGLSPLSVMSLARSAYGGLGALEAWQTTAHHQREGSFSVFFEMIRRQLHLEVIIRFSSPLLASVVRLVLTS
jgi:hypothetical protein